MHTGIPDGNMIDFHTEKQLLKNSLFRTYNHLIYRWCGILHEKNGADKNTVCAILYYLHFRYIFSVSRKTWFLSSPRSSRTTYPVRFPREILLHHILCRFFPPCACPTVSYLIRPLAQFHVSTDSAPLPP